MCYNRGVSTLHLKYNNMCYNCGCGIPNDPMGKGRISQAGGSLTDDDFKKMAEVWGMTVEEAKRHTLAELKKQFDK